MKLLRSFTYAWAGIAYCFKTQLNFRIHLFFMTLAVIAGWFFKISTAEWLVVIVCCILVLVFEMINTAIEFLCDTVTKDFHPAIKVIKDVAAGAVLVCAFGSVLIGCVIFFPKIIIFFT